MMVDHTEQELSELLSAYLDGELGDEELALVERKLDSDEHARRLVEELKRSVAAVANLPSRTAPASLTEGINAQLERGALLGKPGDAAPAATTGSRSPWSTLLSMAAVLAIVCTGVVWYSYNPTGGDTAVVQNRTPVEKEAPGKTRRMSKRSMRGKAPPALPAGRQVEAGKWLAAADVTRLLAVDGKVSHLRAHQFKNEGIELRVAARSGDDAKALARRLESALRSVSVADAAPVDDRTPLRNLASRGFFLEGRPGVNFEGRKGEQQILVRLSPGERDRLFAEMATWSGIERRAVLRSGPVRIRGLEPSRLALSGAVGGERLLTEAGERAAGRDRRTSQGDKTADLEGKTEPIHPGVGLNVLAELARMLTTPPEGEEPKRADVNDATVSSAPRGEFGPAIAAKSRTMAEGEVETLRSETKADRPAVGANAPAGREAARREADSLVQKKMEELFPVRGKPAQRKAIPAMPSARTEEHGIVFAHKDTADHFQPDAATLDDYVTLVFRFVPPKPPSAKPEKPAGATTTDKSARKTESIRK